MTDKSHGMFMPKYTFNNLPEKKQKLIENISLDEFAEYGFESASINRIVAAAGIAKGSFYQYFEGKLDLYKHILNIIGEKKLAYISPVMQNPFEQDFFTLLEEIYRSGLSFANDNPKASVIGLEVFKNKNTDSFAELYEENKELANQFYGSLLDLAITKGDIDPNIDKSFVIHMLINLQLASLDYYVDEVMHGEINTKDWGDDFMPVVNLMINFIKNGIQLQK